MTAISSYITTLRTMIRDTSSTMYSDGDLTTFLSNALQSLLGTSYHTKFRIASTDIVTNSGETPTAEDNYVILSQAEIEIKYSELSNLSKSSIRITDIRGTIDTTSVSKALLDTIKLLESKLDSQIKNANKRLRGGYSPQQMTIQTYTPTEEFTTYTFNVRER